MLAIIVGPASFDTLAVAKDFDRFQQVRATVSSKRDQQHQKGPTTVILEYEFALPDGTVVAGDNGLTRVGDTPEVVAPLVRREGGIQRVTVYYDPEQPTRSAVRKVGVWQPLGFLGLSLLLLIGGVHSFVIERRRRRLRARAVEARRR